MSVNSSPRQISGGKLLRILGVGFGIAVTVGGTVGVGILRTPGLVASHLPSFWLIMTLWVCGGIYALFGAFAIIELGTMVPAAGGWYAYAGRAFGRYGGFLIGWSDWILQSASLAYLATAIGEFFVTLFPTVAGGKFIAIGTMLLFAFLHWMGLRMSSRAQQITSLAKGIALVAFVALCFLFGHSHAPAQTHSSLSMPISTLALLAGLSLALQSVIVTYDGWYSAIYFMEEDTDPARNLPRSAIGGVVCAAAIYLLVNLGLLYALPMEQLAASRLPAADVAQNIFGGNGGKIITALSLLSLLSVINAVLLLAARILFSMSRDGLFSSAAASVSPNGTPVGAMVFTTLASVFLIATGTFEKLIAIAAIFSVVVSLSGFLALFVLRKREPALARPVRAWGYPLTAGIALIGSVLFLVTNFYSDILNSTIALALMVLSYPAFRVLIAPKKKLPQKAGA